jgi:hypothetical protein
MTEYLSYGGGVGSTALLVRQLKAIRTGDLEVIFVDHGGDYPETREYVKQIQQDLDINITVRRPKETLYDYFFRKNIIPFRIRRDCTDKFKIQPMREYVDKRDEPQLGVTTDERWRVRRWTSEGILSHYPLVEGGIGRISAIDDLKCRDLKIPCKSGCFFCPFQPVKQFRRLYYTHQDLFMKALNLENNARKIHPQAILMKNGRTLQSLYDELEEQTTLETG